MNTIYMTFTILIIALNAFGVYTMIAKGYNPTIPPPEVQQIIRWGSVVLHAATIMVLLRFLTMVMLPDYGG